jgi:60 kDa SS-A/Ro ribonucleoprotein
MTNVYSKTLGKPVPQSEPADPRQEKNSAGGFTFVVNDRVRLERFLILGTEGGTYYTDEQKLTKENFAFLREIIERDEQLVIDTVREVSVSGRALRNTQAVLTVAALFTYGKIKPRELMRDVCRTGTHLFQFAEFIELLAEGSSGWGYAKRAAVAEWYTVKRPADLAYQGIKYRQRNGWSHGDLIRLSHPVGLNNSVASFLLGKDKREAASTWNNDDQPIIRGFKFAQEAQTLSELLNMALRDHPNLPWEALPTQFLKEPAVWKQLFYNGQLTGQALVRNITRLAKIGAFNDMMFAGDYAAKLADTEMIKRSRLHPLNYLQALVVHEQGQLNHEDRHLTYGAHRNKSWTTVPAIKDALNAGFYEAFNYVEPTRKRTFLAIDVSGSMSNNMCGLDMSAATVAAAMAMATARIEPYYQIFGFSDGSPSTGPKYFSSASYNRPVLADLGISPSMNLTDVMRKTEDQNFGRTDCALPMIYARENDIEVDTFVIYTDHETWFGSTHPYVALRDYRKYMGVNAKLAVVACTPTKFSIADPSDRGMLDVVGADSNLPKLIAEFSIGNI